MIGAITEILFANLFGRKRPLDDDDAADVQPPKSKKQKTGIGKQLAIVEKQKTGIAKQLAIVEKKKKKKKLKTKEKVQLPTAGKQKTKNAAKQGNAILADESEIDQLIGVQRNMEANFWDELFRDLFSQLNWNVTQKEENFQKKATRGVIRNFSTVGDPTMANIGLLANRALSDAQAGDSGPVVAALRGAYLVHQLGAGSTRRRRLLQLEYYIRVRSDRDVNDVMYNIDLDTIILNNTQNGAITELQPKIINTCYTGDNGFPGINRTHTDLAKLRNITRTWKRYAGLANKHGWDLLAILAFSSTFRKMVETVNNTGWKRYKKYLGDQKYSVILVGDFERPSWRRAFERALPGLRRTLIGDSAFKIFINSSRFYWSVPESANSDADGIVRINSKYKDVPVNELHGEGPRALQVDPEADGSQHQKLVCYACADTVVEKRADNVMTTGRCWCSFESWVPVRVELYRTETMGVGVRSLQRFHPGDIVGEYVGIVYNATPDIGPHPWPNDDYQMTGPVMGPGKVEYAISALQSGNFTRFVNHSCHANTEITQINFRGRQVTVYRCKRTIEPFEVLTVNYGPLYWGGRECLCGTSPHVHEAGYVDDPAEPYDDDEGGFTGNPDRDSLFDFGLQLPDEDLDDEDDDEDETGLAMSGT